MTAVFAHRGCTVGHLENTLEAFLEARRLGADGVELDVRHSADGALVVHHDAVLADGRPVSEVMVADLPSHVPLLDDALAACEPMTVNVEVKSAPGEPGYDPDQALALGVAAALTKPDGRVPTIVSSFDPAAIEAVRSAAPGQPVGWLLGIGQSAPVALLAAIERGYQALHPFVSQVDETLVSRAHGAGLAVNVWTVNSPEDLVKMADLGVDALITDRLPEALAVVAGR